MPRKDEPLTVVWIPGGGYLLLSGVYTRAEVARIAAEIVAAQILDARRRAASPKVTTDKMVN